MRRPNRYHVAPRRWLVALLFTACAGDASEPGTGQRSITIAQGDGQQAVVATMVALMPAVVVLAASGRPEPDVEVTFTVTAGDGWVVDEKVRTNAQGRAGTAWYMGPRPAPQRLTASSAAGTVEFSATAAPLAPRQTYFGANQYIEFIAGDLPLIISAPHGGSLMPSSIPDRTAGTTVRDTNTEELARSIRAAFDGRSGRTPFVIVCRLHRLKLDANREIVEAAQGNAAAERAWREFHAFIEAAHARVADDHQRGFYIDLHGHGHAIPRLELGYLLSGTELAGTDAALNANTTVQRSSIRSLVQQSGASHAELLRGPLSLGSLFAAHGYRAVPGPDEPHPAGEPYFSGGYNTGRHGSRDGGPISGVQIEAHMPGVRDNATNRARFADALADVFHDFFLEFYGTPLTTLHSLAPAGR